MPTGATGVVTTLVTIVAATTDTTEESVPLTLSQKPRLTLRPIPTSCTEDTHTLTVDTHMPVMPLTHTPTVPDTTTPLESVPLTLSQRLRPRQMLTPPWSMLDTPTPLTLMPDTHTPTPDTHTPTVPDTTTPLESVPLTLSP